MSLLTTILAFAFALGSLIVVHEYQPVQKNRRQEIREGSRRDDGKAPGDGLAVERARQILLGNLALALIEHFDVTTQRERAERPLGLIAPAAAAGEHAPEAD